MAQFDGEWNGVGRVDVVYEDKSIVACATDRTGSYHRYVIGLQCDGDALLSQDFANRCAILIRHLHETPRCSSWQHRQKKACMIELIIRPRSVQPTNISAANSSVHSLVATTFSNGQSGRPLTNLDHS